MAQLVEQRPYKAKVGSSSLSGSTVVPPARTTGGERDDTRRDLRDCPTGAGAATYRRLVEIIAVPERDRFADTLRVVQSYVRSEPGAYSSLMDNARRDPEGTTLSLVALGAVLLDIAAGAFHMTPDEMLEKVAVGVAEGSEPALS
ncbi:MAG: hypothetical protein JWM62_2925 [Frankiales bacterium]|jgi:hypothetical protein|nr:hypothetical protein [Frankiales bacterium]